MPSRSATSFTERTSVRVGGRAGGVAIYLSEALSRLSGPPGNRLRLALRCLRAERETAAAELRNPSVAPSDRPPAEDWRAIAAQWHGAAQAALPLDVPAFAALRDALAGVYEPVVSEGDAGWEESSRAAERLWELQAELDAALPLEPRAVDSLLADLARCVDALFTAESQAIARLGGALARAA